MKFRFNPFVVAPLVAFSAFTHTASAVDVIKDNNTNALNLGSSWLDDGGLGDITPGTPPGHVAVWNNTVAAANTTDLGGNLSWAGIRIASPGGVVTVRHAAGQTLTLGASGIDMSAATQNLVVDVSGDRKHRRHSCHWCQPDMEHQVRQHARPVQHVELRQPAPFRFRQHRGDRWWPRESQRRRSGSTTMTAGNGNDTYTGNWTISGGSKVISLRNGTHAWGQGSITLDNGTMSQNSGNWSFSNNVTIASGGGTIYSDSSGNARYLNLTGVISGGGALSFNAIAAMTGQEGFILTGANSFTGPMTINANATVRIGGDATTSMNSTAAGTLGSIASSVAITNNGILGFGRTDSHTFANSITGSGLVRLGRAGGVLPGQPGGHPLGH